MLDYILYILFFTFIIILIIYVYIKFKFGFWTYLPVFHTYNIKYKFFPIGIINHNLPIKNKYTNFKNIETIVYSELSELKINKFTNFVKKKYMQNGYSQFLPNMQNITTYFNCHNGKSFISFFNEDILLADLKKGKNVTDSRIVGIITTRPIRIFINNQDKDAVFNAYYIDYFCLETKTEKNEIFPQLIQTHYYNQCHITSKINPCFFKSDNVELGIVPLCKYSVYEFTVTKWSKPDDFSPHFKLIEINPQNFYLLFDFIKNISHKFDIIMYADCSNIVELIKTKNIFIYAIVFQEEIKCAYFFRKTCIFIEKSLEIVSCFASINNCEKDIFIQGFKISFWKIITENNFGHASVENISDNNIIIDNLCMKTNPVSIKMSAYYFYNFAYHTFLSAKTFILI